MKFRCPDYLTGLANIYDISQFFLLQELVPFIYLTAPCTYQLTAQPSVLALWMNW